MELRVGDSYPGAEPPLAESLRYQYDRGGHLLLVTLAAPTTREIAAVRAGRVELALFKHADVLWLVSRFGDGALPWSDAPYSWHLVGVDRQAVPEADLGPEHRAVLHVVLLDTEAVVRALRLVTLEPGFTEALHRAIGEQAMRPWPGRVVYDQVLAEAERRWSSEQMADHATIRCIGGA